MATKVTTIMSTVTLMNTDMLTKQVPAT